MLFESTSVLLRNMVLELENGGRSNWDDYLETGRQCIYELHQMSRASARTYKTESNPRFHTVLPASERAVRAIPYAKAMNVAIRQQNRPAAVEAGRAALSEINGTPQVKPAAVPATIPVAVVTPAPAVVVKEPARPTHRAKKPVAKRAAAVSKRTVVAKPKRKTPRVSAASSR